MNSNITKQSLSPIVEILRETDRQYSKWGEQNHSPEKWLAILGEEFGEACLAFNDSDIKRYSCCCCNDSN